MEIIQAFLSPSETLEAKRAPYLQQLQSTLDAPCRQGFLLLILLGIVSSIWYIFSV
jgi:hypothetical protein